MLRSKKICLAACMTFMASGLMRAQEWIRTEQTDALRGTHFVQFNLPGKFLTRPSRSPLDSPMMVVQCLPGKRLGIYNGRFLAGFLKTGSVVNIESVQYRINDGKIQPGIGWSPSTDGLSAFFPDSSLNNFLYGHMLTHKEGTGGPVKKVVVAINEYLGGEIVMQFDIPDPVEMAEACGAIIHKRSK